MAHYRIGLALTLRSGRFISCLRADRGSRMTRSELISQVLEKSLLLRRRQAERVVGAILDVITEALERGDRVELRDFGAFEVRNRSPKNGRNPRTGAAVAVPAKFLPFFRPGKGMRLRLNGGAAPPAEK